MHVCLQLLKRDLLLFFRSFSGNFFDTLCLFFTNVIVFSYFMLGEGLKESYGSFLLIGAIASFGLFDIIGKVSVLLLDIHGDKNISYILTLPIKSTNVFLVMGISWALASALLTLPLFFVGKILLFHRFDLHAISYIKLIPMYITINIFFGFFSLWLSGMIKGLQNLGSIFMRFINPLFMFGGYFYSWETLYKFSPALAYLNLINPMLYVMEGMRSAALGGDYLPFFACILTLWGFNILLAWHGCKRLKVILDCI